MRETRPDPSHFTLAAAVKGEAIISTQNILNQMLSKNKTMVDAGVEHIRIRRFDDAGELYAKHVIASNCDLQTALGDLFEDESGRREFYITGKLAEVVRDALGFGEVVLPAAALWAALQQLVKSEAYREAQGLAAIDLSASGYLLLGVDDKGKLKDDLMIVNPRCGAGSGVNIDRVLQKLAIGREQVDELLAEYVGDEGKAAREKVNIRADRCGVFSSSATISDKNQGIPLPFALAVTLKSEVVKVCRRLPPGFEQVILTGGIFNWAYARDCARDYLYGIGVLKVAHDDEQSLIFDGVNSLVGLIGSDNFAQQEQRLKKTERLVEFQKGCL